MPSSIQNLDSFVETIASDLMGYGNIYDTNTDGIDFIKKEVQKISNIESFFYDIGLKDKIQKYYSMNYAYLPKKYGQLIKNENNVSAGYDTLTPEQKTNREWFYYEAPSDCFFLLGVKNRDTYSFASEYMALSLLNLDIYTYYGIVNNVRARNSIIDLAGFISNQFMLQKYNGDFHYRSNRDYDDFFIEYIALSIDVILAKMELKQCYGAWFAKKAKDSQASIISYGNIKNIEEFKMRIDRKYKYTLGVLNQEFMNI